jgi:acetyltransferase-like isoleucine patch superfamily enzyme
MLFDIKQLKYIGKNVTIGEMVKIVNPDKVEIDDYSRIDDFTIIVGGKGIKIGKFVHIASYTSVIGGGELIMEDFSGTAAGVRLITGSDEYTGKCLTNPTTPIKYRPYAITGKIHVQKHVILATNSIVYPNVTIGEGTIVGAASVVNLSLDPWGIYMGYPARKIKIRESETIHRMEKELLAEIYGG